MSKAQFRTSRTSCKPPLRHRPVVESESSTQPRHTSVVTSKSTRSKASSGSSPSSFKRGVRSKTKEISALKEQLVAAWDAYAVPFQHREWFYKAISGDFKAALTQELEAVSVGKSLITGAMQSVTLREEALAKLRQAADATEPGKAGFLSAVMVMNEYREQTLIAVEAIIAWAQSLGVQPLEFEWNSQDYVSKLKSDTAFLSASALSQWFAFREHSDPFLLYPLEHKPRYKAKENSLAPHTLHRYLAAAKHLKLVPVRTHRIMYPQLRPRPPRSAPQKKNRPSTENQPEPRTKPKAWQPDTAFLAEFSQKFFDVLCQEHIDDTCGTLALVSAQEMVTAALSLHSNSILDRCLQGVLDALVPEIQLEAYLEMKNEEYVSVREDMFETVKTNLIKEVVHEVLLEQLAKLVVNDLVDAVDGDFVVQEALQEETQMNSEVIKLIGDTLIDNFAQQDWLEELAESELGQALLDKARLGMSAKLQAEIFKEERSEIFGRVAEDVYFDLLNTFPGGCWLENIVKNCLCEFTGATDFEEEFVLSNSRSSLFTLRKKPTIVSRTFIR